MINIMIFKMKILLVAVICGLFSLSVFAEDIDDDSILDAENDTRVSINNDFSLQSFQSCEDMESVVFDYLKESLKHQNYYPYYRGGPMMIEDDMDFAMEESAGESLK